MNFDCSEKGIEVQCMDSSHVALVGLLLRECAFSELLGRKKLQNFSISIYIYIYIHRERERESLFFSEYRFC